MRNILAFAAVSGVALSVAAAPARAQDAAEAEAVPAEDTVEAPTNSYDPAFFAQFAPRTALDMVRRIPGFSIRESGGGRGLGQADTNVLVNGERLSGKSDSTTDQLARIAADSVVRIELVDGASLDVPGLTGQVANVIVQRASLTGQYEWQIEWRPDTQRFYPGDANVSVSGASGDFDYTLALASSGYRGGVIGPIFVEDGLGTLLELQDYSNLESRDAQRVSANLGWDAGPQTRLNLNGSYEQSYNQTDGIEDADGGTLPARLRNSLNTNDRTEYELSGDIAFPLVGGRLKLIGLRREDSFDYLDEVTDRFVELDPTGGRYASIGGSQETIGRAEYGWAMLGGDWQLAAEAAFNSFDRLASLFTLTPDDIFVPVPFDSADARVTEDRYEALLSYSVPLASDLSLQLVGGAEKSTLVQSGVAANERTFVRPKGSANLGWRPGGGWDVSLKVERAVGQLSFNEFLARPFLDDDNSNAGNNELVPPQVWNTDLQAKKDLGAWGSATLRLYDRRIEDLVQVVPLPGGGESPGNIDSAWRRGFEFDATVRFDPVGFTGARVDLNANLQNTSFDDPVTLLPGPLSSIRYRQLRAEFRHDIPASDWAYGAELFNNAFSPSLRRSELSSSNEGPLFLNAFVENKDVAGLKVNLGVTNLLDAKSRYRRTIFVDGRDLSPIAFQERGDLTFGRIVRLSLEGSF